MMRTFMFLGLCLLLLAFPVYAEQNGYRLRVPSVEEYLAAIPRIAELDKSDFYLQLALHNELLWRYPQFTDERFDLLYPAILTFRSAYSFPVSEFSTRQTQADWNLWLIDAWFRDNPGALETEQELHFGDFEIIVTRADLSGNGTNELLLEIRETISDYGGQYLNYLDYWVLQSTSNSYRRVETPLQWYSNSWYSAFGSTGIVHTLQIADINGDGLQEWVVLQGSYIYRGYGECRWLRVLGWRDDRLVDLMASRLEYCTSNDTMLSEVSPNAEYTFTGMEIAQIHERHDSWNCQWQQTTIFAWNGSSYTQVDDVQEFEETFNCALRLAEDALRSGDYDQAIIYYEQGLALPDSISDFRFVGDNTPQWYEAFNREQRQYARIRLATAYAVTGRLSEAHQLIDTVLTEQPASDLMAILFDSLAQADTGLSLCASVYVALVNILEDRELWSYGWWETHPLTKVFVGVRLEDVFTRDDYFAPNPAVAGCDLEGLIDTMLSDANFNTQTSPVDWLQEHHFDIREHVQDDFNGDGITDWIVRFNWPIAAIMFLSDGDQYQIIWEQPEADQPTVEAKPTDDAVPVIRGHFTCGARGEDYCALFEPDSAHALEMIASLTDESFRGEPLSEYRDEAQFWVAVSYRHALALEALDRPDEALAEYVAIYEAAPESAWGMLAALHFEVVHD